MSPTDRVAQVLARIIRAECVTSDLLREGQQALAALDLYDKRRYRCSKAASRRVAHLQSRIDAAAKAGKDLSWDKQEVGTWQYYMER